MKMKKTFWFTTLLLLATVVVLVWHSPVGQVIIWVVQVRQIESALRQPDVYEPVARRLALYCQSDQSRFPDHLTNAWLPKELNDIGSGWATVSENSAQIEMGGFHHFGYFLTLDESQSDATTNVWKLHMYSEESDDTFLMALSLPKTDVMPSDKILANVIASHDARIDADPEDLTAHQEKIGTYLRFDKVVPARNACREMLEANPDEWWAVLVNALLDASQKTEAVPDGSIVDWVNGEPSFFRYLDLAYFYQLTDQPAKASDAIAKAAKSDANTEWGHGGNSEFRGYSAAMYAYKSGHYRVAEELCEKLLKVTINGDYAKGGLRNLLVATQKAQRGETVEVEWDDSISPFDAFETIDIEKLLGRKVSRPTQETVRSQQEGASER